MNIVDLKNKKIGIWGFGVVGKSVYNFIKDQTPHIQILDQKLQSDINIIMQTPQSIIKFLQHNDIIIPSPGISLLDYQQYHHKFLHEIDLFSMHNTHPTIAITGTLGKTTITSFLQQCINDSIAAGNIGHPMLDTLHLKNIKTLILELSSYQLQYTKSFAPDLAIWTNFYPNHLDHHATLSEYFAAKCMIMQNQRSDQTALIAHEILDDVFKVITPRAKLYTYAVKVPSNPSTYPIFYIDHDDLVLHNNGKKTLIFENCSKLPSTTFMQNWIIILAALYLHGIDPAMLMSKIQHLKPEAHRLEYVDTINGCKIYNDSKSTVWQATKHAVAQFQNQKIMLILGGMSKGTDRAPLMQELQKYNVFVCLFGSESDQLVQLCQEHNLPHMQATTFETMINYCMDQSSHYNVILFSPAGASFDLFANYQQRGNAFKELIKNRQHS